MKHTLRDNMPKPLDSMQSLMTAYTPV